jgi:electron transfer flavoprotein alpha subunit
MGIGTVWVFAEADGDNVASSTLELLTKARDLGDTVEAVYAGGNADAIAGALGEHGASKVYSVDPGDSLVGVVGAAALAKLVEEHSPALILFDQSYDGRDAIARLSARIDRTVVTNAADVNVDGGQVRVSNAIFGGTKIVQTAFEGEPPCLIAFRPKSFAAEPSGGGAAEVVTVDGVDAGRAAEAKVLDRHVEEAEGPKLEDADVVVSGGRGLGGEEHYSLVEALAKLLKGAPGASRAIVDAGWVPYSHQVGQTGKTVKPSLYIACGISGAMQHVVGMKDSGTIIAINKDPDAPIFSVADLGVVGDVHKVLPALIEALEAR